MACYVLGVCISAEVLLHGGQVLSCKAPVARARDRLTRAAKVLEQLSHQSPIFLYSKLSWMNLGYKQSKASPLADLLAFKKVKMLGSQVRLIISGVTPLSTKVEEF